MKIRFITLLSGIILGAFCFAQQFNMGVEKPLTLQENDLEQKAYSKVKDGNDNLCALIKVRLSNSLPNPLILEVGGLGVTKAEERPDGEYWFFVPYQVKNLEFKCKGYKPMPKIPVNLKEGCVYAMTLRVDASTDIVTNVVASTNYLKMNIEPSDAMLRIGKTKNYELGYFRVEADGSFAKELDYGTWHYHIEHELYKSYEGSVELDADTPVQRIRLEPNFSYVSITTEPEGVDVLIDNKFVGKTPLALDQKYKKGTHSLKLLKDEYYSMSQDIVLDGKGERQSFSYSLRAQFGVAECVCEDPEAEIWVDRKYMGIGRWKGNLNSKTSHTLEARKAGHKSQSISFSVVENQTVKASVGAPVPLYALLGVETSPNNCEVYIDGDYKGSSPLKAKLLIGSHKIRVIKSGFVAQEETIELEHNQQLVCKYSMKKGDVYVPVSVVAGQGVSIYIDGVYKANETWSGSLTEGEHEFKAEKSRHEPVVLKKDILSNKGKVTVTLPELELQKGSVNVSAKKGSIISLECSEDRVKYKGVGSCSGDFPVGSYSLTATHPSYKNYSQSFVLKAGDELNFNLKQKRDYSGFIRSHRILLEYAFVPDTDRNFFGLGLSRTTSGLGYYADYLTDFKEVQYFNAGLNLHLLWGISLYGGAGMYFQKGYEGQLIWDAGLRFRGLSAGVSYLPGGYWVPKFGLAVPTFEELEDSYFFRPLWGDYNPWIIDAFIGLSKDDIPDCYFGVKAAWVPRHFGLYASYMYQIKSGRDNPNVLSGGLVWRISDSAFFDVQIYGGYSLMHGASGWDVGIEFTFSDDILPSFFFGVTQSDLGTIFNLGGGVSFGAY
ncbi:MAG: PEGA domain-containing protein [Candidatus Cryptobacteroides sp.]